VERLASTVDTRCRDNTNARYSGVIINTCGLVENVGYRLLVHAALSFKADVILVLGDERLYGELKDEKRLAGISVQRLAKSPGVVIRDPTFRKKTRNKTIKQYFYGISNELHPHPKVINFKDIFIYRVGALKSAPAVPNNQKQPPEVNKLELVRPDTSLQYGVLAVSFAKDKEALLKENVAGFLYVTYVDMQKQKLTCLAPAPGPLPHHLLLTGTVKWYDE